MSKICRGCDKFIDDNRKFCSSACAQRFFSKDQETHKKIGDSVKKYWNNLSEEEKEKAKERLRKKRQVIRKECPNCHIMVGTTAFSRHYRACISGRDVNRSLRPKKIRGIDFDPNWGYKNGTRTAWNKGKSKEYDERIKKYGLSISKSTTGKKGIPHTEEAKKKISEIRKKFLNEHPEKVPYLLCRKNGISYPEKRFLEYFFKIKDVGFQHPVKRYHLDFANVNEKLYFEVDGDQHYSSEKAIQHDIERTKNLSDLGWFGIRIRWSEFQKLNEEDKMKKVKEIIEFMKWEKK